jgi:hypothetical protein
MPGHDQTCTCDRCPPVHERRRLALDAMHTRLTTWSAWLAGAAIAVCAGELAFRLLLA